MTNFKALSRYYPGQTKGGKKKKKKKKERKKKMEKRKRKKTEKQNWTPPKFCFTILPLY
jgi:hypothetical protein